MSGFPHQRGTRLKGRFVWPSSCYTWINCSIFRIAQNPHRTITVGRVEITEESQRESCAKNKKRLKPEYRRLETFSLCCQVPVEGFEPSTPHGDLFLRQARIPFRHAGFSESFTRFWTCYLSRNKRANHQNNRVKPLVHFCITKIPLLIQEVNTGVGAL